MIFNVYKGLRLLGIVNERNREDALVSAREFFGRGNSRAILHIVEAAADPKRYDPHDRFNALALLASTPGTLH